jgi:hypothetical protein
MSNIRNAEYRGYTAESVAASLESERQQLRKSEQKNDRVGRRIALLNIQNLLEISEKLTKLRQQPAKKAEKSKPVTLANARPQQNVHKYGDDSKKEATLRKVLKRK